MGACDEHGGGVVLTGEQIGSQAVGAVDIFGGNTLSALDILTDPVADLRVIVVLGMREGAGKAACNIAEDIELVEDVVAGVASAHIGII